MDCPSSGRYGALMASGCSAQAAAVKAGKLRLITGQSWRFGCVYDTQLLSLGLQGVCFGVIKRKMSSTRGFVGRGHGFVMLKQLGDSKQPAKAVHDSGSSVYQLPKCWWTAPVWVTFDIGKLTTDFGMPVLSTFQPTSFVSGRVLQCLNFHSQACLIDPHDCHKQGT